MDFPKSCHNSSVQDPWKPQLRCFYLDRYNPESYTQAEKDEASTKHRRNRIEGNNFYKGVDHTLTPESQRKKKNLVSGLKEFQKQTGIDESEYIEMAEDALSDGEVDKLEAKFNRGADRYYEDLLKKSGAFTPVHAKEAKFLGAEMRFLKETFAEKPLFVKGGLSKVQILSTLKENLRPRVEFRARLRKLCENTMIRDEYIAYFDQLAAGDPSVFLEPKEERLKQIMKEVKEVEDADPAVQNEFRKKQANRNGKDTATLKKEVNEEFNKRVNTYIGKLGPVKDKLFGGPIMVTPMGKMRAAAWEFIEWFKDLPTFAKMDEMTKALDGVIKERQETYGKRDELLKSATPDEAKRIKLRTDEMRFHNLKAYLPELEAKLGKTSVYALEYSAHLEDAEANHIPLFSETEKVKMKTQMQTADLDLQKAKLTILVKETIPEREDLIYEYAALDDDLRNDKDFLGANHEERKSLLKDAKLQEQREQQNPLDLSDVDIFDEVTRNEHIKDMQTAEGRNAIEDKLEMFEQQFEVADVQGQLYQKIFGVSKHMEQTGNSMKDEYLRDRAKWMRINENLAREKIENVKEDPRRLWQREALEEASTAYDMHEVSTSGGEQEELQVINNLDDKSNEEKIKKARYPQFILLVGEDGKDELHPHQRILKKQTREVARVLNMLIRAMGFDLHLNSSAQSAYVNSPIVKREMARAVVESYFAKYLDVGGANNSDHFIEDVANAA